MKADDSYSFGLVKVSSLITTDSSEDDTYSTFTMISSFFGGGLCLELSSFFESFSSVSRSEICLRPLMTVVGDALDRFLLTGLLLLSESLLPVDMPGLLALLSLGVFGAHLNRGVLPSFRSNLSYLCR